MRFSVVYLQFRGQAVDGSRIIAERPRVGELRVEHAQDAELHRPLRVVRLIRTDQSLDPDLLPPLLDVSLVAMSGLGFTLTGFERIEGRCYQQSWWARPA